MVRFIQNLLLYWRFKYALRLCEHRNRHRTKDKYIVANLCGTPYLMNRSSFRRARQQGVFRVDLKWQDVYSRRITSQTLQQWLS